MAGLIPPRKKESRKGLNGVACVVGGSRVYHGAPFLAAMGAMRSGVDLVYVAVPGVIAGAVRSLSPDLIVFPLPDAKLTTGGVSRLVGWLPRVDCIGVGPGLGPQKENVLVRCLQLLGQRSDKMVLDADALRPGVLGLARDARLVVTPHAGEFNRLFSTEIAHDVDGRVEEVKARAKEHGVTVLLKGPVDVISDGDRVALNTTHTPAMTVGGTGDVLTGVTTGLICKGIGAFEACCCAAFLNGLAGLAASESLGLHITASDVAGRIASVMRKYDRVE